MKGLTPKQEAFVDAYIETGNASEAARRAGYSAKTASRSGQENLQKPVIKAAIDARQAEIRSKRTATVTEVMEFLTSVMRGETTDEQIVVIGLGDGVTEATREEVRVGHRERLKAAEQILKRFPRELDTAEQKARIKRLEADLKALEQEKAVAEDVVIVDDIGEDDE